MPDTRSDENQAPATPEVWLEEHGDLLYKFAMLRVNDSHAAEDLVQETLVKAFAGFDRFRHDSSVRTWLFQILKNEISRYFRRRTGKQGARAKSNNDSTVNLDTLLCPQISNEQFATAVEREEFWDVIRLCFEKIPEHLLETFLYRLANPNEKIDRLCSDLAIKPANFSIRLFRSRLMLRKCVEQAWLEDN